MAEERSRKQPEVSLHIEAVPYRSAAWRELWRQIFIAVAEELDRVPDPSQPHEFEGGRTGSGAAQ
jgi:hypothetical protein